MIELEKLKIGQKIYGICTDEKYINIYKEECTVIHEYCHIDCLPAKDGIICDSKNSREILTKDYENDFFYTKEERDKNFNIFKTNFQFKLINSDYFWDCLKKYSTSCRKEDNYNKEFFISMLDLIKDISKTYRNEYFK